MFDLHNNNSRNVGNAQKLVKKKSCTIYALFCNLSDLVSNLLMLVLWNICHKKQLAWKILDIGKEIKYRIVIFFLTFSNACLSLCSIDMQQYLTQIDVSTFIVLCVCVCSKQKIQIMKIIIFCQSNYFKFKYSPCITDFESLDLIFTKYQ